MYLLRIVLLTVAVSVVCATHLGVTSSSSVVVNCNVEPIYSLIYSLFGVPSTFYQCTAEAQDSRGLLEMNMAAYFSTSNASRYAIVSSTDRQVYSEPLPTTPKTLTVTFQILKWFPAGIYKVNTLVYTRGWESTVRNGGSLGKDYLNVTSLTQTPDVTAPTLTNLIIASPQNVSAVAHPGIGYYVQVNVTVEERQSGLQQIIITGYNTTSTSLALGSPSNNKTYSVSGTWTSQSMFKLYDNQVIPVSVYVTDPTVNVMGLYVTLIDQAGNTGVYSASDLKNRSLPHRLHFNWPTFTVLP